MNKAKPSRGLKLMTYNVIRKNKWSYPLGQLHFFLTNSNDTTSKFVIKVCNHLFTLNFYITSSSRFSQLSISHNESPNFILRVSELLEGGKV